VANQLGVKKTRTRTRGVAQEINKYRLTVTELELFANQLDLLPVKISGQEGVKELMESVEAFKKSAAKFLDADLPDAADVTACVEAGSALDVDLPELSSLKGVQRRSEWLEETNALIEEGSGATFEQLRAAAEVGRQLPSHPAVERALGEIAGMLAQADTWKKRAKSCLSARPSWSLSEVERLVKDGESISDGLPSLPTLREAVRKAREWCLRADLIKSGSEALPFLETLESLVAKGRPLPVRLEMLPHLESQVAQARAWRERAARVFLKKGSSFSLLDVLCPRMDLIDSSKRRKHSREEGGGIIQHPIFAHLNAKELADPKNFVKTFKEAEAEEMEVIRKLCAIFVVNFLIYVEVTKMF